MTVVGHLFEELKRRNVLRVAAAYLAGAWLVVQMMDSLMPVFGLDETAARPVVIFLALGFVLVIFLSWFFQFTSKGLRSQAELDLADEPTTSRSHRRLDAVIVVFLSLAVGYFAVDKFFIDPARDRVMVEEAVEEAMAAPAESSIAVLPFLDLSPEGDQEYFSDGLSEELLNLLAKEEVQLCWS